MGIETALAAGAIGLSMASTVAGGMQAKRSAEFEAQEMRLQAEREEIAADQDEAARRKEMNDTLATIDAIRAGRGLSNATPTAMTVARTTTRDALSDIRTARFSRYSRGQALQRSATNTQSSGRSAMLRSFVSAGAQGLSLGSGLVR